MLVGAADYSCRCRAGLENAGIVVILKVLLIRVHRSECCLELVLRRLTVLYISSHHHHRVSRGAGRASSIHNKVCGHSSKCVPVVPLRGYERPSYVELHSMPVREQSPDIDLATDQIFLATVLSSLVYTQQLHTCASLLSTNLSNYHT
jgi:hypothetical protein